MTLCIYTNPNTDLLYLDFFINLDYLYCIIHTSDMEEYWESDFINGYSGVKL